MAAGAAFQRSRGLLRWQIQIVKASDETSAAIVPTRWFRSWTLGDILQRVIETLSRPWPWYVAGPLIGLMVPLLLIVGGRVFGVSSSLRAMCAVAAPGTIEFFRFDWRGGAWNLAFVLGVVAGGFIGGVVLENPEPVAIAEATRADLIGLGIREFDGLVPGDLFSWSRLLTPAGFITLVVGGFLVGFGAAYAGGCTSGHAISGLASRQLPSLVATLGFFAGGLVTTHLLLPLLL